MGAAFKLIIENKVLKALNIAKLVIPKGKANNADNPIQIHYLNLKKSLILNLLLMEYLKDNS